MSVRVQLVDDQVLYRLGSLLLGLAERGDDVDAKVDAVGSIVDCNADGHFIFRNIVDSYAGVEFLEVSVEEC